MNRIIKEHYPVSKLPEELREGLDPSEMVTVTVLGRGNSAKESANARRTFRFAPATLQIGSGNR